MLEIRISTPGEARVSIKKHETRIQNGMSLRHIKPRGPHPQGFEASSSEVPMTDLRDYLRRKRNVHQITQITPQCHYELLARRPSSLVLMMINSCSYVYQYSCDFSYRSLIKILIGDCFKKRSFESFHMVIPVPEHQDHTFALGGSRLGSSGLKMKIIKKT